MKCAHIARSPADGLAMVASDALIAPSTDPAWTPLFLKAGALVMETGGSIFPMAPLLHVNQVYIVRRL